MTNPKHSSPSYAPGVWLARARRSIGLGLAVALFAFVAPGHAQEPEIPNFWDMKEQLQKPNVSALPRLRFLTTTDFPPFNFIDGNGRLSGFHVDLARAICRELQIEPKCQIQALPWNELEGAMRAGDGEALLAGLPATADSRKLYAFSRPYLRFPARFIVRRLSDLKQLDAAALSGKRVGVLAGSAHEQLLRDYFPDVQPVTFTRQDWLYRDLKESKIDAAFGDGMRMSFWLSGSDAAGCCRFAGGPYMASDYLGDGLSVAVKAETPELAAAFDYALREITAKGTFAELYLRYFPVSFF